MRHLAILLTLGLLAPFAALAAPGDTGVDLSKGARHLYDATCTDSYDTPATTLNVDASDENNFDNPTEALNLDKNLHDAVQTSGSADGFCDSAPWTLSGNIVTATDEVLYIGPIKPPRGGLLLTPYISTVVTTWSVDISFNSLVTGGARTYQSMTDSSSTSSLNILYGPSQDTSAQVSSTDQGPWPFGTELYLALDLNGAGTWAVNLASYPTLPETAW